MLFTLLFMPTSMVAQTDYDNTVTFTALAGSPEGYTNETYAKLFDGKKTSDNFSKWCCGFNNSAYVVFEASKAGVPVGYTITTGNDNSNCGGRNPKSWKLYGNNEGKDGEWTLIQEVKDDKVLQDVNCTPYDFTCEGSTSYKYFKWEISAIHSGNTLQVGEFELKLQICSHKNADGSSALGKAIETFEATCTEHGYTTHKCSICHSTVKVYKDDELKAHTLTHHEAKAATCTEAGKNEYWQCSECNKLFSDEAATKEITDAVSLEIPAKGHQYDNQGTCTVCGATDFRYALFNNLDGITGVTITDNGSYSWQMLNLKAEGMEKLGFTFPEGSNVLMSSNYNVNRSSSEIVIKFNVSKPILLTSQVLVSSEKLYDKFIIYVDDKQNLCISGKKQTEYKVLLSAGEHSLKLSYNKDRTNLENADRAFLYNLKTSTTIDDYVADYESSNNTLTFKKIKSDNLGPLDLNRTAMVYNEQAVSNMCPLLGISESTIKNIVFDQSINTYTPTSLNSFFQNLYELQTITGFKYLNTAKVTDMYSLFDSCEKLSSLDLTNFNTEEVTDMSYMFNFCKKLSSLDLTNFNTAKVTKMNYMFFGCYALATIYASDKFVTNQVTKSENMFSNCGNLKGFIDYSSNSFKNNKEYANYKTGYFTKLVVRNGDKRYGYSGETAQHITVANLDLTDDKDFAVYEPFTATTATYNRDMKTGTTWATLCLPFGMSLDGKNFRAFKLLSANETTNTVELEEIKTNIEAGTPVIIKMNEGQNTLDLSVTGKEITKDVKTATATEGNYQLQGLYAQKEFSKDADNNCYVVKGNKLMNPAKLLENTKVQKVASKPFRAYMVDNSSVPAVGAKMFSIGISDSTTAIDTINTIANDKAEYYDLQGKRLNEPQKGINIVKRNGKTMKVIIK